MDMDKIGVNILYFRNLGDNVESVRKLMVSADCDDDGTKKLKEEGYELFCIQTEWDGAAHVTAMYFAKLVKKD